MVIEYYKQVKYEKPDTTIALAVLKLIPSYWEASGAIGGNISPVDSLEEYKREISAVKVNVRNDEGRIKSLDFALEGDIFEMFFGKRPSSINFTQCPMSAVESSLVKAVRDHGCCFRLSVQHPYNVTDKRKNRVRGEANFYINSGRRDNEILLSWYSPEDGKSLMSLRRKFREAGLVEARR